MKKLSMFHLKNRSSSSEHPHAAVLRASGRSNVVLRIRTMQSSVHLAALVIFVTLAESLAIHGIHASISDGLLIVIGTFGISRLIAREKICQPLREACPMPLKEVVSCPRCIGAWVAMALTIGFTLAPENITAICALFGIIGANIVLHETMGLIARSGR